ncbi:hypothetical protein HN011_000952 [Eciton burchellii]|nr:hypothetical protein HN011_000952 [Eciton burchellii]
MRNVDDNGARMRHCHGAEFRLSRLKSKSFEIQAPNGIEFTFRNSPLRIPLSLFNIDLRFQFQSFLLGRIDKCCVYSVQIGELKDINFYL